MSLGDLERSQGLNVVVLHIYSITPAYPIKIAHWADEFSTDAFGENACNKL